MSGTFFFLVSATHEWYRSLDPPSNTDILSVRELEFCCVGWNGGDLNARDEERGGVEDLFTYVRENDGIR